MIEIDFRQFKKFFFDRAAVLRAMDKKTRAALSKAGAFIRRRAQTSMKYRARGVASAPGSPPHAHRDGKGPLLRKFLFFGYDPAKQSVVIGPTALPGQRAEAAPLNEFGGTVHRTRTVRSVVRRATPAQAAAYRRKLLTGEIVRAKPPQKRVVIRYPKRSFMGPSLQKEVASGSIPKQWANSVKRN